MGFHGCAQLAPRCAPHTAVMQTLHRDPAETATEIPVDVEPSQEAGTDPAFLDRVGQALEVLLDHLPVPDRWRATALRMGRSMCVSVGTSALSATVLAVLAVGFGMAAGTANVLATICGIGPSYAYNRRWAWRRTGRGDLWREVVPFWVLSLSGLVLSTAVVAAVSSWGAGWPDMVRAVALPAANIAVFGALWLVQFVLLDRVLFADPGAVGG
jgi:putative flippase GtrA